MRFSRLSDSVILVLPIALALLTGCGKADDKKVATQVAARVNGTEITVHQINYALSKAGNIPGDQVKVASQQVLNTLVDQQILVQKAIDKKLDRDPRVMQTMDAARQQILAQAFIEQELSTIQGSSPQDVKDFYAKHPELFEKRRIYRYQQLGVQQTKPELVSALGEQVSKAKSLSELGPWLKDQKLDFRITEIAVRSAEQLPLTWLPTLMKMTAGSVALIQQDGMLLITQQIAFQEAPLDEKQATPYIQQYLLNQKRLEASGKEMKQLRAEAKVEYLGDFAQAKPSTVGPIKEAVAAPASTQPDASKTAEGKSKTDASFIEKGLSGLK